LPISASEASPISSRARARRSFALRSSGREQLGRFHAKATGKLFDRIDRRRQPASLDALTKLVGQLRALTEFFEREVAATPQLTHALSESPSKFCLPGHRARPASKQPTVHNTADGMSGYPSDTVDRLCFIHHR